MHSQNIPSFGDIRAAAKQLPGAVVRTPLVASTKLSDLTGANIFVKHENMQATNSFKDRGALIKLASLDAEEKARGVVAMSAGNHAQAVAYRAREMGIAATIVMPLDTPFTKISRTEALGAEIELYGETLAESEVAARRLMSERNLTLIHPYDDPAVMAGQGTIGLELFEDHPKLDAVVVPVGGAGLITGIAIALKELHPDIDIIGVEVASFASMTAHLAGREPHFGGQTLADGIAVKKVASGAIKAAPELISKVLVVSEAEIEQAICHYLTEHKTLAEGAAAAALAAVLQKPEMFAGRDVALICTGGNIDPRILSSILYRQLEREDRIVSLRVHIDDRPGVLGLVSSVLGKAGANILEVYHGRMFLDMPARSAALDLLIETKDTAHAARVIDDMRAQGFVVKRLAAPAGGDLSSDEG
ncbi:MAG: threonine ammonia-lyase [Hyphomicrobiales bacterium]